MLSWETESACERDMSWSFDGPTRTAIRQMPTLLNTCHDASRDRLRCLPYLTDRFSGPELKGDILYEQPLRNMSIAELHGRLRTAAGALKFTVSGVLHVGHLALPVTPALYSPMQARQKA